MLSFENDYSEGAHEKILKRLVETNLIQETGYGNDSFCASAKEKIRTACGHPEAHIQFLVGGTQTNATVIAAMLQNYQGVVATEEGAYRRSYPYRSALRHQLATTKENIQKLKGLL